MLFAMDKLSDAIKCVKSAMLVTKHDVKLYIILCKMYRKKGDLKEAYSTIQQAIQIYKSLSKGSFKVPMDMTEQINLIFNEMAIDFAMKGEFMKALALYNRIIADTKKLNLEDDVPVDYRYYVNRGDCYR
jgi:tetratricopeptide (TPR) repeat protein